MFHSASIYPPNKWNQGSHVQTHMYPQMTQMPQHLNYVQYTPNSYYYNEQNWDYDQMTL